MCASNVILICLEVCFEVALTPMCRMLVDDLGTCKGPDLKKNYIKKPPKTRNVCCIFEMLNHLWVPVSSTAGQEEPTLAKHLRQPRYRGRWTLHREQMLNS